MPDIVDNVEWREYRLGNVSPHVDENEHPEQHNIDQHYPNGSQSGMA